MPYPESYSTMIDLISQKLQDTSNVTWTDAELLLYMTEGLREISQKSPHIYMVEFLIESRQGSASSTSAGNLVDATNSQFVAGDVGKIVYNTKDRTWAYITTFTSTTTVALSNDIMVSGEGYRIFNKNCNHQKEIYLGDMPDWLWIKKIEFPVMEDPPNYVRWESRGKNVIRLITDDEPDNTKNANAKKQVWVSFAMRHKLSQLTDLSAVTSASAGVAVAATSMALSALQTAGTIERGQEFTIADERSRAIYIVTANAAVTANTAAISFFPPIESSAASATVVTFESTSFTPALEGIFADMVAGRAAMHKSRTFINTIGPGANRYRNTYEWGKLKYDGALRELEGLTGFTAPCATLP